jgi:hypothetical protein
LACYPWILWAFHGLVTTGRSGYLVAAALSLAALLFSHNISFMLFGPLLAAYLLFLLLHTAKTRPSLLVEQRPQVNAPNLCSAYNSPSLMHWLLVTLMRLLAAGLLGLGLAAIFWLPAFGERYEIQLEGITRGFFDFRANFISLPELFSPPRPLDLAAINPEFPLSLGLPHLSGAGLGVLILLLVIFSILFRRFSKINQQRPSAIRHRLSAPSAIAHAIFFACFLGLYAFLAVPASQSLWEAMPLLELAEFPWRMLGPAILCASLLAAFPLRLAMDTNCVVLSTKSHEETQKFKKKLVYLSVLSGFLKSSKYRQYRANSCLLIAIFLTIALNGYYLYPSQFIAWGTPTPADAFHYEVTSGAIGTTSTGEFLPRAARQHPRPETLWPDYADGRLPQKIDPTSLPPDATAVTLYHRSESEAFQINTPQAFSATIRTLYWPGWQVYLDDQPTAFTVTANTGLIQTVIPPGQHTLTLRLESTPLRTTGRWLTTLSCGLIIMISLWTLFRRSTLNLGRNAPNDQSLTPHFFLISTLLLFGAYGLTRPLEPVLTLRSDPDQPRLAGQVLRVDFGQPASAQPLLRLVGLDSLPSAIAIGAGNKAELNVTVYWRAMQELETNYSVFLHLDAPNGQTFATVDEAHPDNIPTRNWPPGLYLRNPLRLPIPANLPPIRYQATVGLYDRATNQRLVVLPGQDTVYQLGALWLTTPRPRLPDAPLARFGQHISLWQATYPAPPGDSLALLWETDTPLDQDYSIFVHLLDTQGNLLNQADGLPYGGLYPLPNWQPGQVVEDARSLTSLLPNPAALKTIAIGLYDPVTGERLPAVDAQGLALPNHSFVLPVAP